MLKRKKTLGINKTFGLTVKKKENIRSHCKKERKHWVSLLKRKKTLGLTVE